MLSFSLIVFFDWKNRLFGENMTELKLVTFFWFNRN